jgi:hypothetical protein
MNYSQTEDTKNEHVIGRLALYIVSDAEVWRGGIDEGDVDLNIDFTGPDWKALFYDLLNCPKVEPYVQGEDIYEYDERNRAAFRQSIPEYPMLGRIWNMYEDVGYTAEQVRQLRDECLKLQATATANPHAIEALGKLILACNEAIKMGRGLFLVSD